MSARQQLRFIHLDPEVLVCIYFTDLVSLDVILFSAF